MAARAFVHASCCAACALITNLRIACSEIGSIASRARCRAAGIAVAIADCMPAFAYSDPTIRVPKLELHVAPRRTLPTQFAPGRERRAPHAVWIALVAVAALAAWKPVAAPEHASPAAHAPALLKLLRG